MTTKIFNISLPEELLKIIDWQAKLNYATRSEYVKGAILTRLKSEGAIDKNGWRQQSLEDQKKEQLKQFLEEYRMATTQKTKQTIYRENGTISNTYDPSKLQAL